MDHEYVFANQHLSEHGDDIPGKRRFKRWPGAEGIGETNWNGPRHVPRTCTFMEALVVGSTTKDSALQGPRRAQGHVWLASGMVEQGGTQETRRLPE